ncbi:hypothetical protein GSH19_07110 [Lactobacillus sp. S2-2]|uniref:hypothetical protein n=1 Tax=Lactobacillus sp. S2-2 TaxID=2692917 RepID=UPI001F293368|nr:hypothetical protein [Lactobacillus sp. S2-2]MCF6515912.1 hypothetical protein [Lactobacillus sp. S2-2]
MKKSIKFILLITILIIRGGLMFSINNHDSAQKNQNKSKIVKKNTQDNSSSLVLYFSVSGNTKNATNSLGKQINAPVQEITPVDKFPTNYDGTVKMARKQLDDQVHPKIKKQNFQYK